ncbi:MAG TPA: alpha-amylase family glycosyl hydrolase, partial [Longimicrobiales bacterium]
MPRSSPKTPGWPRQPRRRAGVVACMVAAALAWPASPARAQAAAARPSPAWTSGATCYEIFVRSFQDSDGDGIGDLKGLIQRLDYINDGTPRSLGARCIWLMPVDASPSYHGYDVSDYYRVNPQYGTNEDMKRLVAEAHRRGIRVLVDLVLNHSSDRHPHFQAALNDTTSPFRTWYRLSPTDPGKDASGQDHWRRSPVRDEFFYAVFGNRMPDLNYENPAVREEAKKIARFWLNDIGVDGFRLDAVEYLVEEGSQISGTPGTHAFLHEWGDAVHKAKPDAFTVGEATWGSLDRLMPYYPDQLDSYFPFEVSDSLIACVKHGSARGLLDGYLRLQGALPPGRYSPFLRNHDQTRTLTALAGDAAGARLAATLLFTLPGFPFVYYGEEIGMTGDKPDPRLRTPMQWRAGPGAGFTTGTVWEAMQPDSATVTVEAENADPGSLLGLYRRLIHLRSSDRALASGELVPLSASDDAVVAYLRRAGSRTVLVVANLGNAKLSGVTLTSAGPLLPPGSHASRNL